MSASATDVPCAYGACKRTATHWVDRAGPETRRSGPVCPVHAKASAARFPNEARPRPITDHDTWAIRAVNRMTPAQVTAELARLRR